jgi:GAF domain-containing protein
VCAEGVETLGELRRLADLDVAYGQGYGIARPSAPWIEVAAEAADACLRSFQMSLAGDDPASDDDHDRRLEVLARQLATVASLEALQECLGPIAAELQADEVRLAAPPADDAHATELLADDPAADPFERAALQALGFGARLTLPIAHGGRIVGCLEAYAVQPRPWSRFQVGRGRIIACLLGPLLEEGLAPAPSPSLIA